MQFCVTLTATQNFKSKLCPVRYEGSSHETLYTILAEAMCPLNFKKKLPPTVDRIPFDIGLGSVDMPMTLGFMSNLDHNN